MQKLSKREKEVSELLRQGLLNKQIAYDLGISTKTVSTYKTRLRKKMREHYGTRNKCRKLEMQEKEDDQTRETNVWHWF